MSEPAERAATHEAATQGFVVDVAPLLRRPGNRREVLIDQQVADLGTTAAEATRLTGSLLVEAMADSVSVTGAISAEWEGACRRCLEPARGAVEVEIQEVYEREPSEGETYQLADEHLDLAPMVREQVLLSLPLAPLCSPGCAGPAPDSFPARAEADEGAAGGDPRWAALDALVFDDADDADSRDADDADSRDADDADSRDADSRDADDADSRDADDAERRDADDAERRDADSRDADSRDADDGRRDV